MLASIKTKARLLSERHWFCSFLVLRVSVPTYHFGRRLWYKMSLLVKSLVVFGFLQTIRVYTRYIYANATRSYINVRLKRNILRLACTDTRQKGSAIKKGFLYHDILFPDQVAFRAHRKNSITRLRKIVRYVPFKGRRVLDIGCANGSIALGAAMLGAIRVIGVDYDQQALRVADTLRDKYRLRQVEFMNLEISPERLTLPEVDILIWLSNWMWLVKAHGLEKGLDLLFDIPYACCAETMIFESAANDGLAAIKGTSQGDIEAFLRENTPFVNIKNVGPFQDKWRRTGNERNVFICTGRRVLYEGMQAVIERIKRDRIRKTFEAEAEWAMEVELRCLQRLKGYPFFPKVLAVGESWFEMEYCGERICHPSQLAELNEIVRILKKENIVHRDINRNNLLFHKDRLFLIDFGWAVIDGKQPRDYIPKRLGRGYYDSDNFDDRVAAERLLRSTHIQIESKLSRRSILMLIIRKYIPESIKERYRLIRARLLSIGLTRSGTFDQPEDEVEASKDISVVVAIHDSPEVTRRCLESIEKYGANAEIILVDDGSQLRETIDLIQDYKQRNGWIVVRHKEPKGHSRSCEAGSRLATRPYLCFLNSDTVVTPWSWSAAKRAFETDPRIAVTGPSTSWAFTKQVVQEAKLCRHYWNDCQIFAFAQKYIKAQKYSKLVDLTEISGFAFFIKRKVWNDFGGFDENLPDYGNETELCIRLSKSGWRLVWTPNSYIHHFGKMSYSDIKTPKVILAQAYIREKHGDQLHL